MKDKFLSSEGKIGPIPFIIRLVLLIAFNVGATWFAIYEFSHWHHGTYVALGYFLGILFALMSTFVLLMQLLKRLRDMDKAPYLSILLLIPGVNVLLLLYACTSPSRS